MKNIINKFSILVVAIFLFATACENEPILFDSSMNLVGFDKSSLTIIEDGDGGVFNVYLGAPKGTEGTTVTLEVSTAGLANPAIEGQDFTLLTKEVSVDVGSSPITISPIDNDVFTGNKMVKIKIVSNSAGYQTAEEDSVMITIADNEHPLKQWLGTYEVAAVSYWNPGPYDETWTVETTPVEGDLTQIAMTGVAGSSVPIIATLDTDAMTITLSPGQGLGDAYGYGETVVFKGNADITVTDKDAPLEGTISADGTINIDLWAHQFVGGSYDGYVWDVFNTTWTLQ